MVISAGHIIVVVIVVVVFFFGFLFYLPVPQQAPVVLETKSSKSTVIVIRWRQNHSFPTLGNMIVYKEANKKFKTSTMKSVPHNTSEAVLEDLKKFTNYTIRVFAFSSKGNGVPSDAVTVRTQEDGKFRKIGLWGTLTFL